MQQNNGHLVPVWDIFVRLFHWLLVIAFVVCYATEDDWQWLHVNAGYLVLGLIILRIAWGFVGTQHARFGNFVRSSQVIRHYLKQSACFQAPRYLGHNPAGGAMVILLLLILLTTTVSGLFVYGIEDFAGPFAGLLQGEFYAELFETIHEIAANLTLLLILLHVAGVIYTSIEYGENLIKAMLTGKKQENIS